MKTYKDLKEIEQVPYNGYTAVGLFVGAGGSCMGVRAAGVKIVSVNEFIPAAKECYEKNHKGVPVLLEDIRNITGQDLLKLGGVDKVDIVYGSPPCSGFSANGLKENGWGIEKNYSDIGPDIRELLIENVGWLKKKVETPRPDILRLPKKYLFFHLYLMKTTKIRLR